MFCARGGMLLSFPRLRSRRAKERRAAGRGPEGGIGWPARRFPRISTPFRSCSPGTRASSAAGPPTARRNTASGRAGPGPRPRPRSWRSPPGSRSSGSAPGDHLAIIGRNRPVPLLGDGRGAVLRRGAGAALPGRGRRRDGLRARALRRALRDRRRPGAGGQGAGGRRPAAAARSTSSTSTRAACATTTTPGCTATPTCRRRGRERRRAGAARRSRARTAGAGRRTTPASCSTPPAPPAGRRAWCCPTATSSPPPRRAPRFDRLTAADSVLAYLPMAWVGDFIFSMGQAYVDRLLRRLPRERGDHAARPARDRPELLLRPAALLRGPADQRHDPHGGRRPARSARCSATSWSSPAGSARRSSTAGRSAPATGCATRSASCWSTARSRTCSASAAVRVGYTAGEAIGPEIFAFYRALGINLKQLYGQTEASVFITQQPDGEVRADTVGVPSPGRRAPDRRDRARSSTARPASSWNTTGAPRAPPPTKDAEGWVATGDAGFIEPATRAPADHRPRQGRGPHGRRQPVRAEVRREQAEVLPQHPRGGGVRQRPRHGDRASSTSTWPRSATGPSATTSPTAATRSSPRTREVYAMIQAHVEEVNRGLAADPMLAGCQVRRFLILHKELDADDGELTRTRKVRRRIIEEKYADLIRALYDGSARDLHRDRGDLRGRPQGPASARRCEIRDAAVVGRAAEGRRHGAEDRAADRPCGPAGRRPRGEPAFLHGLHAGDRHSPS